MHSSNFHPLSARWPQLYKHAVFAEQYAHTDPHTAVVKLRCFAEVFVGFLYRELRLPSEPSNSFFEKLMSPYFQDAVGEDILQKLHTLRMLGNKAAHGGAIDAGTSLPLIEEAYLLGQWLYKTYSGNSLESFPPYKPLARPSELPEKSNRTAALAEQLASAKEELGYLEVSEKAAQTKIAELGQTLDATRLQKFKDASAKAVKSIDFKAENTSRLVSIHDAFAGYSLTNGQAELVNSLERFLDGRTESVFLLKGYAGTGKTFITKGLTEYFRAIGRNYILAAPTGKASKVIAAKTQSPAYTIHKSIYSFDDLAEYRDDDVDGSETFKFYAKLAVNNLSADTVFIVDEASMIPDVYQEAEFFRFGTGYLLSDFLKFVNLDHNDHTKKVIFIGDDAQLPPVGMNFSPALDASYLHREYNARSTGFELSEVVRQKSESGVIANAIPLRKALRNKTFNQLTVDLTHPDVRKVEHADWMASYLESCSGKINGESIVIAHSNSDVTDYNIRIREYFFPGCLQVTQGDKVMSVANRNVGGIFISNGDFGLIRQVLSEPKMRSVTLRSKNKSSGKLEEVRVSMGFRDVVAGFKDINGVAHFFEVKIIEDLLYSKEPALSSDQNKALYLDFCIRNPDLKRNSQEFKNTLKADPYFNALRLKFGYAITCHKAQGSEWNNVFVKCKSHQSQLTADYFRWLYTAITRTAKKLYLLDPPDIRPWSRIKLVSPPVVQEAAQTSEAPTPAPAPLPQPAFAPSLQDFGTFGIPEGATFLLSLLAEVRQLTDGKGIAVDDVLHNQWQESYHFKRGAEFARVDVSYTSKNRVSSIASHGFGSLGSELADLLSPLKGRPFLAASGSAGAEVLFSKHFLNAFHEKVLELCGANGITVQNVVEHQWSQRYSFTKDSAVAVYDIFYNGKDQFTTCLPVVTACSPGSLVGTVGQLLTEGMQG